MKKVLIGLVLVLLVCGMGYSEDAAEESPNKVVQNLNIYGTMTQIASYSFYGVTVGYDYKVAGPLYVAANVHLEVVPAPFTLLGSLDAFVQLQLFDEGSFSPIIGLGFAYGFINNPNNKFYDLPAQLGFKFKLSDTFALTAMYNLYLLSLQYFSYDIMAGVSIGM